MSSFDLVKLEPLIIDGDTFTLLQVSGQISFSYRKKGKKKYRGFVTVCSKFKWRGQIVTVTVLTGSKVTLNIPDAAFELVLA